MHPLTFALVTGLVVTQFSVNVRAGDALTAGTYIITPAAPVWLLEQPYADSPMLTARTFGGSAYGDYHVKASLEISCSPQSPTASLALQITPTALGFDIAPFEGPDASANGPLRITTATRTTIEHSVNGVWTYGGAFQIGTIFALSAAVPHRTQPPALHCRSHRRRWALTSHLSKVQTPAQTGRCVSLRQHARPSITR